MQSSVQYADEIFANGNPRGFKYPLPLVPGGTCIARVLAVPPDASTLKPGQLAYVELAVRARDNAKIKILRGYNEGTEESTRRLFGGNWRNGVWATLATAPLESVHALDEDALLGRLGYKMEELGSISQLIVPYAGLSEIGFKAGDTVLVAPATGSLGGAATGNSHFTGNEQEDIEVLSKFGPLDIYFDISPKKAGQSFIKLRFACLKAGGRMSLMGGIKGDLQVPYGQIVHKGVTIKSSFMNTSQQDKDLIKTIETGALQVGLERV
ncbi:hypothetical protein VPNG_01632 [Cytospora leucostoma]|uniref:Uncharacterized protein n=1 Tax=Cytospora leucostoma TaxID=1230097 RepID=A0A423XJL2_9PEZI|nr:hypothetical protein VPNG_01632 [Cytospora leucostoma]